MYHQATRGRRSYARSTSVSIYLKSPSQHPSKKFQLLLNISLQNPTVQPETTYFFSGPGWLTDKNRFANLSSNDFNLSLAIALEK